MRIRFAPTTQRVRTLLGFRSVRSLVDKRSGDMPPWMLLLELFLGIGWVRAAVEKIVDPMWWNGVTLERFIESHEGLTLLWYRPVIEVVVDPNLLLISIVVVAVEVLVGASLLTGHRPLLGVSAATALAINFLAAGAVNPAVFYLVSQIALGAWRLEAMDTSNRRRAIEWLRASAFALAVISAPFISTLDPESVVEDPAAVLVLMGLLVAILTDAIARKLRDTDEPQPEDAPMAMQHIAIAEVNSLLDLPDMPAAHPRLETVRQAHELHEVQAFFRDSLGLPGGLPIETTRSASGRQLSRA